MAPSVGCALRPRLPAGAVVDLTARTPFRLSLPEARDPTPPPLLLYFHGLYGDLTESNALHASGMSHGYVVAAPLGLDDHGERQPTWNAAGSAGAIEPLSTCDIKVMGALYGRGWCYEQTCTRRHSAGCAHPNAPCWWTTCDDSVGHVEEILAELERSVCFDTSLVFGAGFSNGAMMLFELAASRLAAKFAGFAVFHGLPLRGFNRAPARTVPLFGVWGSKDVIMPPDKSAALIGTSGNTTCGKNVRCGTGTPMTAAALEALSPAPTSGDITRSAEGMLFHRSRLVAKTWAGAIGCERAHTPP